MSQGGARMFEWSRLALVWSVCAALAGCGDDDFVGPTDHPYIQLSFLDEVDPGSPELQRLRGWVDAARDGSPGYAYSATDAIWLYRVTGDEAYLDHAIEWVDAYVSEQEAAIDSGERPSIASDSYLEVGDFIEEVALVYDYGFERLSSSQRQRWAAFAEQAVWNVWNHEQAEWGGNSFPWSGWSVDNPGNNYHFSFLRATAYWALASQRDEWLGLLRDDKFPALEAYYAELPGGGSREGTGYGTAQLNLFELYNVWEASTGESLADASTHSRDTIEYWVHGTVPTLDYFAPIGDQSRNSMPELYDYHEILVHQAVLLHGGTDAAAHGTWWLNDNAVDGLDSGFNYRYELLPRSDAPAVPADRVHHATGVGHLFARTAWDEAATWLAVVAGPYDESHAHQDQGSFTLYDGGWRVVTVNVFSHSGIEQDTIHHNVVRFVRDGATIEQNEGESSMAHELDGDTVRVTADLAGAFSRTDDVTAWARTLELTDGGLVVRDTCSAGSGVEAVWQVNVADPPSLDGGSVVAGNLRITPITPAAPDIQLIDWTGQGSFDRGWRVELRGGCPYEVQLTVE